MFKVRIILWSLLLTPVLGLAVNSVTMPVALLDEAGEEFSFVVYGDIQGNYRDGHDRLVRHMMTEDIDLILHTGDISADKGENYEHDFLPAIDDLASQVPFFPAPGNHDVAWGSPVSRYPYYVFFQDILHYLGGMDGNEHLRERGSQKLWYSFRHGSALFIALDSNFFIDEGKYRKTHSLDPYRGVAEEQLTWLAETLRRYHDDPSVQSRFIYFHHSPLISDELGSFPILGLGGHPGHAEMLVNLRLPETAGVPVSYLLDLFRYYRVTAVFTGHEHFYERWRETILEKGEPVHTLNGSVLGTGGVKPRGRPEYEADEIDEVLEEDYYSEYLQRISTIDPDWQSRLEHRYPNPEDSSGRFHSYMVVTVTPTGVQFSTRDSKGQVRDFGSLQHIAPDVGRYLNITAQE